MQVHAPLRLLPDSVSSAPFQTIFAAGMKAEMLGIALGHPVFVAVST